MDATLSKAQASHYSSAIYFCTHASGVEAQLLRIDSTFKTINKSNRAMRNARRNGSSPPGHDRDVKNLNAWAKHL